jgi:hypothetical protein
MKLLMNVSSILPEEVRLRRHLREHKDSPWLEPATLIHANPQYAVIRYESGKEDTVSLEDLSPAAEIPNTSDNSV